VKRVDGSANANDAEPTIENSASDSASASLNALTGSHSRGPAMPLAVGGEVKQARLLKPVPPVYPPSAKTQHVSGDVKLDALIDANGKVTSTKVISGPVLLHQAAMDAVKQWQYDPAQLNGKATSMHLMVTVQFRLQ
jgi:protein TonB